MSQIWFTADLHLGHWTTETRNVINYCKRPFKTIEEHDAALIENWNERVKPGDRVYVLGDVCFGTVKQAERYFKKLKGQIFVIAGNHDRWAKGQRAQNIRHLVWVRDLFTLTVRDGKPHTRIVLCHYPMLSWDGMYHGSWMLHGHSHGKLAVDKRVRRVDVGVDVWGYKPVSYEELRSVMVERAGEGIGYRDDV